RVSCGHEIAVGTFPVSIATRFHALAPPVGLVELITPPELSTPTQRVVVGHEMPESWRIPSTFAADQFGAGAPELVDVKTLPALSTAAQKFASVHEIDFTEVAPSTSVIVQSERLPLWF